MLNVTFLTANQVLFEGEASKVIVPGEKGVFEVGLFHKAIVSRLLPGSVTIDAKEFSIRHGLVKVKNDRVIVMAEIGSGAE